VSAVDLGEARRVAIGRVSTRVRPSTVLVGAALVVVAVASTAASLLTGTLELSPGVVWDALGGGGPANAVQAVQTVRVPRAVAALAAGAAFGVAGALTQTLFRNDLASPDVIGVQTGCALAAVVVLTTTTLRGIGSLAVASFVGGVAFALVVWLASASGRRLRMDHVLIGVALAAMGEAAMAYLLRRADIDSLQRVAIWLAGDLTGVSQHQASTLLAVTAALLVAAAALAPSWKHLQLGDDLTVTFGVRVGAVRTATVVVAVGLVATATSICGPIAFVALVSPHIGRRLARERSPSLWLAATTGAALVAFSDVAVRRLVTPETPVGLMTIGIGAPVLLYLVVAGSKR
jgi:iron complex transport system permease protein